MIIELSALLIMSRQGETGKKTEEWVKDKILEFGLDIYKPVPDKGIDFVITSKNKRNTLLNVQVKGRGKVQKNKKYRWFQIRTPKKLPKEISDDNLLLCETWRKKVELVDFFILVCEMYREFWIFEPQDIEQIIHINNLKYGNRKGVKEGFRVEMDLDVKYKGLPLTELFQENLNNWKLITDKFI